MSSESSPEAPAPHISLMVLIAVDKATPQELDDIHEVVKSATEYWWHHFSHTWIAAGKTPQEWKDLIKPVMNAPSAALIVMLPKEDRRPWWMIAPEQELEAKTRWLGTYLAK